jgi:hypothetical protein
MTSEDVKDQTADTADTEAVPGESRWAAGDDERENREHIAKTGEPKRDALGNGEGAS